MLAFKREAEAVLRDGGYQKVRTTGKEHDVWEYPDGSRPVIHVPGTPRDPDHALIRLRRAVRKGTTPHIPQGTEQDLAAQTQPAPKRSLVDQLVRHANPALQRRMREISANHKEGEKLPGAQVKDVAHWLRKCVDSHGAIPGAAIREAGEQLYLGPSTVSGGRSAAGMLTYKLKGDPTTYTDYAKRIPENGMIMGAPGKNRGKGVTPKHMRPAPVTTSFQEPELPADPDEDRGRPLVGGDLTDEQRAEAQERMRRSTELADAEAAEIQRQRNEAFHGNGNGLAKSEMDTLLEMIRDTALKETKALTSEDIMLIRGHMDTLRRRHDEDTGIIASISKILDRVEARAVA